MCAFPRSEELSDEQSKALEDAAFLVIKARNKSSAMLRRHGIESPPDFGWFGNRCQAREDGRDCACSNYTGDGGPCTTRVLNPITGEGSTRPFSLCGHLPSKHIPS